MTVNEEIQLRGADNNDGVAGTGGYSFVYGNVNARYISVYGGETVNGSAGSGGYFEVEGNLNSNWINLAGGVSSNNGTGASGGTLNVDGDMVCFGTCDLSGGSSWSGSGSAGSAGNIYCRGSITVNDDSIEMDGGYSDGGTGGNGGYISCRGDLISEYDIQMEGGEGLNGGSGGNLYVGGDLVCADDVRLSGGNGSDSAGSGGYINVDGSITVDAEFEIYGGDAQNGNGGNGGSIYCNGNVIAYYVTANGGATDANGYGGNGGIIECRGDFKLSDYCDLSGGYCISDNEVHASGQGGTIKCANLCASSANIQLNGGSRYGDTTQTAFNSSPNAGNIYAQNATFNSISMSGGSVSTNFPNGEGGLGGYLDVSGTATGFEILLNGGSAVGANGGRGGNMTIKKTICVDTIESTGGAALDSAGVGSDAGENGSCGPSIVLNGGSAIRDLYLLDGNGPGAAPSNLTYLQFSGNHCINTLTMPSRSNALVFGGDFGVATLKMSSLVGRDTFWNGGIDSPTTDVTDGSGVVSIYIYSYALGTWYRNTQTPLV